MVMPIFVARQLVRHRTAAINEESLRYVEAREEFWIPSPEECKAQSIDNKQGSGELLGAEESTKSIDLIADQGQGALSYYRKLLTLGLSKELARSVLPLGTYTAWYWTANLRNIFHLLGLRMDSHAQYQTRVYADAMFKMVEPYFPVSCAAFKNHVLDSVTFSGDEWEVIIESIKKDKHWIYELLASYKFNKLRKTRQIELLGKLGL